MGTLREVRQVIGIVHEIGGGPYIVLDVMGVRVVIKAEQDEQRFASQFLYRQAVVTAYFFADHWRFRAIEEWIQPAPIDDDARRAERGTGVP